MKTLGQRMLLGILLIGSSWFHSPVASAQTASWLTDLDAARSLAAREHRMVLVDFTGSDWCGWCKRLKSEVFDQAEFSQYAEKNLVLVEIDFPKNKPLGEAQQKANQALAGQYGIQGFPTLVILDSAGKEVGRTGYAPGGPKSLIERLQGMGAPAPSAAPAQPTGPAAAPNKSIFSWVTANARAKGDGETAELKLKGLSRNKDHRMALINTETLEVGDEARVPFGDKIVRVLCLEIRDKSVLVKVEGEATPRELRLGK